MKLGIRHTQVLPDHTLQATALVHEAYLKLIGTGTTDWIQDQEHFLAVALSAMRRVLLDHARARSAAKRGGMRTKVEFDDAMAMANDNPEAFLVIDEMISKLTNVDPRMVKELDLFESNHGCELNGLSRKIARNGA